MIQANNVDPLQIHNESHDAWLGLSQRPEMLSEPPIPDFVSDFDLRGTRRMPSFKQKDRLHLGQPFLAVPQGDNGISLSTEATARRHSRLRNRITYQASKDNYQAFGSTAHSAPSVSCLVSRRRIQFSDPSDQRGENRQRCSIYSKEWRRQICQTSKLSDTIEDSESCAGENASDFTVVG